MSIKGLGHLATFVAAWCLMALS